MHAIKRELEGRLGYVIAGLGLAGFAIVALAPFDWDPPVRIPNAVVRLSDRTLKFTGRGIAQTHEPFALYDALQEKQSLVVHLRVQAAKPIQKGPARILAISQHEYAANLVIGQDQTHLIVRLRTPETSLSGRPPHTVGSVFETPGWKDIRVEVDPETIQVAVNDRTRLTTSLAKTPFTEWDATMAVALGNERTGRRAWQGLISRATVAVGDRQIDYLRDSTLQIPAEFRNGTIRLIPALRMEAEAITDAVLNFLCFVPLGWVLAMLRGRRGSLWTAVVVAAVASLMVEIAQLGFESRVTSVFDWLFNVSGATVGGLAARWTYRDTRASRSSCRATSVS